MSLTGSEGKRTLRRAMLERQRALSETARASLATLLTKRLLQFSACQKAQEILAYLSLPGEADLDDFIRRALAEGKEIYAPVCLPDFQMEAGRLSDMEHFVKGPYGLRDLPPGYETARPENLDLVLVPAVAVDYSGHRLGRGAGYYDRFLSRVSQEKRVAVVWDFQVTETLPVEEHDKTMGAVITEKRSIVF
jgi:5-formyltetrahydrofolate cyclo-ligase